MIRTITLNPGFDHVFHVGAADEGVGQIHEYSVLAAGKGVNAARVAVALGASAVAYALVGARDASRFAELMDTDGVSSQLFAVAGVRTRNNLTVLEIGSERPAAHFKAEGLLLRDHASVERLAARLYRDIRPDDVVGLHGSNPRGCDVGVWADLAQRAEKLGARLFVDVNGRGLPVVLGASAPMICKPNVHEIGALAEHPSSSDKMTVGRALDLMSDRGVKFPMVTLGRQGVALRIGNEKLRAFNEIDRAVVEVGAGDAMSAALESRYREIQSDPMGAVRWSIAVASAYVSGVAVRHLDNEAAKRTSAVVVEDLSGEWL
jgi:fructose-1-phosphate kinase PfkB-like protein